MNKFKTFAHAFSKSLTHLNYYRELLNTRFSFSLKYFWVFSLCIGLVTTISTSIVLLPGLNKIIARVDKRLVALYPQDLVIKIENGRLTTNAPEPLSIPIPYELFTDTPPAISDQKQTFLLTIDTDAPIDDFNKYNSLIFANSRNLALVDRDGTYRIYDLKEAPDMTVDRPLVEKYYDQFRPLLNYIPALLVLVLTLVFILFLPLTRLVSLLFLSLFLLLAAKVMNLTLSFSKIYQIGLHSLTLPVLIQIALSSFQLNIPVPFFFSIMFILYNLVIFATLKQPPTSPPIKSAQPAKKG